MLLSALISIIVAACQVNSKRVKFRISNESPSVVDSVKISSYNLNAKFTNLIQNEKYQQEYNVVDRTLGEGAFLVSVFVRDSLAYQGTFGYHSSPSNIKPIYNIFIKSDYSIREK